MQRFFSEIIFFIKTNGRFLSVVLIPFFIVICWLQFTATYPLFQSAVTRQAFEYPGDLAELPQVLSWLKANSAFGDVVLAPFQSGHQIMAFADRAVVVSTKIYPSEVPEVAERFRDWAAFLFATDPRDAERILDKYDVKYVFLPRQFELGICEEVRACHFIGREGPTAGTIRLNPEGRKRTVAGQLLAEIETAGLKKIWSSDSFIVYRVAKRTMPAQCELSAEEKKALMKFVRASLKLPSAAVPNFSVFREQCNLALGGWVGSRFIGGEIVAGRTLGEALIESAAILSRSLGQISLSGVRVEAHVWHEGQNYPLSRLPSTAVYPLSIARGYELRNSAALPYFLPYEFNVDPLEPDVSFEAYVCGKMMQSDLCGSGQWRNGIVAFVPQSFIENEGSRGFRDLVGPLAVNEGKAVSRAELRSRLEAAGAWLLAEQDQGKISAKENAFAGWVFAELYGFLKQPLYLAAWNKAHTSWENRMERDGIVSTQELVYAALAGLSVPEQGSGAIKLLLRLYDPSQQSFYESFRLDEHGVLQPAEMISNSERDHAAFYALVKVFGRTHDGEVKKTVEELDVALRNRFFYRRIIDPQVTLREAAWLSSAYGELYKVTRDPRHLEMVIAIARWMMEYQYPSSHPLSGAYWRAPQNQSVRSGDTGVVADAIATANDLMAGEKRDASLYRESVDNAFGWLAAMQYGSGSIRVAPEDPRGALQSTGYFILAGIRYLHGH